MDKDIHKIMELVGNKHCFVIFVIIINFVIWINTSTINYSVAFIEAKPEVEYEDNGKNVASKLNYEICEKYKYNVTKDYKYSMITDFKDGTECNQLKTSLIGTVLSFGVFLGNFLFQVIPSKIGFKNLLVYFHYLHAVLLIISIFYKNYYYFQVLNFFIMFLTKIMLNTSLVINNELVDLKYKSLISSFINSGNGLGGMFYVLLYFLLKDWRYVFIVGACISAVTGIIVHIFYYESLAQLLIDKKYNEFYNTLLSIAKKNKRLKEFEDGISQNEEYKKCLEQLKSYTLTNKNEKESEKNEDKKIKNEENQKNTKSDELLKIKENTTNRNNEKQNEENQSANSQKNLINVKPNKKIKGSFFQLFKYSSVRYIAIILSVGWFCNATLFYGLAIGIKTLKGSQYRNTAILYLCDFCAYNLSGLFSNSKLGRKLSLQIFTFAYGIFCLVMCFTFDYNKNVVIGFYFCARFSMICSFCVYYTFAFESYPISVANIGYSLNSATCSVAGIVIPFIIEYLKEKYVFLIYGIFGVVCTGLFFFLKETRGMPRADNIKEVEEEMMKEQKIENVNNKES